ncbi:MAG: class I SAM-dependent methyltransferase [Syntrophales bacterium]
MEMFKKYLADYRDNWFLKHLDNWIRGKDLVLDLGAGNSCMGQLLEKYHDCRVLNLEVAQYQTHNTLPLVIYNGRDIPFKDGSFDVVLILFVLHHADEPAQVLKEAKRICRRSVIVFEDYIESWHDLLHFRIFHVLLACSKTLTLPRHELDMEQMSQLAKEAGFNELWKRPVERQLGFISPRHVIYRWDV